MAAFAVLAGCGSTGSPSAGAASASTAAPGSPGAASSSAGSATTPATRPVIVIHGYAYQTPASVSPGATVQVRNEDGVAHTVTADSGNAFDDKATPGKTTSFTAPTQPGSYPFHCDYHGNMHGTLVVT